MYDKETEEALILLEATGSTKASSGHKSVFIQKRDNVVPLLKNFKQNKIGGSGLIPNMQSVFKMRRWHNSPEGRTFHRKLGRWISTRDTEDKRLYLFEKQELQGFQEFLEEELSGYNSLIDQVEISLLLEAIKAQLKNCVIR